MLFEESLDPDLSDDQERCYSRVATLRRSFARCKEDRPKENELKSCLISHLSISSSFHQFGDLWSVTDCTQELDSDEEDGGGVGDCLYHAFVSLNDDCTPWVGFFKPLNSNPNPWYKDKSCTERHL